MLIFQRPLRIRYTRLTSSYVLWVFASFASVASDLTFCGNPVDLHGLSACEVDDGSHMEDKNQPIHSDADVGNVADDDEQLLKMSLLQGSFRINSPPGQRRLSASGSSDASNHGHSFAQKGASAVSGHPRSDQQIASTRNHQKDDHDALIQQEVDVPAHAFFDTSVGDVTDGSSETSFLQTDLVIVNERKVPEVTAVDTSAGPRLPSFASLDTRVRLGTLAAIGAFVPMQVNTEQSSQLFVEENIQVATTPLSSHRASLFESALPGPQIGHRPSHSAESAILFCYMVFYMLSIAGMFYSMSRKNRKGKFEDVTGCHFSEFDLEEHAYRKSVLSWLTVDWASPWVARWGHSFNSALTKIKAYNLPQLGWRQWQTHECGKRFEALWQQEITEVGLENASIARVIPKLWTKRVMVLTMLTQTMRIFLCQLYTVILIEHALSYFQWLQQYVQNHDDLPNLVVPMLCTIVSFSSLPFFNVLAFSISSAFANRLDQQLCGGLAYALFRKAQRLPSNSDDTGTSGSDKDQGGSTAVAPDVDKKSDNSSDSDGSQKQPEKTDLMNLINFDVAMQLAGGFDQVCLCINSLIVLMVLFVMLWIRLKLATIMVLMCVIPTVAFTVVKSHAMSVTMQAFQEKVDKRVTALREVLYGMKIVKCYAWEEAMEDLINGLRAAEVGCLSKYFDGLGVLYGLMLSFPRLLIFSGLMGYAAIYGHQDVVTIFTCMVILGSLRCTCELFVSSLSRVNSCKPTIRRVEEYLKQAEAPLVVPGRVPVWVQLQSSQHTHPKETQPDTGSQVTELEVSMRGSFSWVPDGPSSMQNLEVDIGKGELVAVLGEVGSGKSTFLHAVLGELYPSSDAMDPPALSRPHIVAYCPQVPHIAEGSIRDNIIFGQPADENRYMQSLAAASLEKDITYLAGGDKAVTGARGITLSGGQKARVAMARAAYNMESSMVLIDDPFGAVDAPTAKHLLENLILGDLLKDRTRVIVMQPEAERLRAFDRAIILGHGRIVENGPVKDVMQTHAYQRLLRVETLQFDASKESSSPAEQKPKSAKAKSKDDENAAASMGSREDEHEGRPTWFMFWEYLRIGRLRNILNFLLVFCLQVFIYLLCDLVLVSWTNTITINSYAPDGHFLMGYLFWLSVASAVWFIGWNFGARFSLRISTHVHDMVLHRVLRAPIDRFFDKSPVGRIMNRMHVDVTIVDLSLFLRFFGTFATIVQTIIPMVYIHAIMPWFLTLAAVPLYYLIFIVVSRAWATLVPLMYCIFSTKSLVASRAGDVTSSAVVVRAFQDNERLSREFSNAFNDSTKCFLSATRVLKRWLVNRVSFLWSFFTTTTFLVAMLNVRHIGTGSLGLCLTNLLILEVLLEPNIENSTGAIFEFIALARIHEYLGIPQERPMRLPEDKKYRSFTVKVPRTALKSLSPCFSSGDIAGVQLGGQLIFEASQDGLELVPVIAPGSSSRTGPSSAFYSLAWLCPQPTRNELVCAEGWHRIVSVNSASGNASDMVRELCRDGDEDEEVLLDVRTGWLSDGARVEISNLRAGYADIPRDVLKDINLVIEQKTKVAIAGTTGCGKSSMLLVLLRVIEPRCGTVLLDGVNAQDVGLATLRTAIGLVPQDPVLFSGTLRYNLDPFGTFTDDALRKAVDCVHLSSLVDSWPEGLYHQIGNEGGNLSFGQRQLVCLARMVLRKPALLLLDEATSAIDPNTQELVQNTLDQTFVNSTIIAVAHRLETVLKFDQVVVMEEGEVVEEGPVRELKEKKGGYLRNMLETKEDW